MAKPSISKVRNSDSKGRITLGAAHANKTFKVSVGQGGSLLLEPVHEREAWLFRNPEALASVRRGMQESREGKAVYLGSFAQYADLDVDEA